MFRMQCMLAIEMGGAKLSTDRKQVLYIISYLRDQPTTGSAIPKDFSRTHLQNRRPQPSAMFKDYGALFGRNEETFDYVTTLWKRKETSAC